MTADTPGPVQVLARAPRPALRPFIRRFLVVTRSSAHSDAHLPDARAVAAFTFRGRCRLDDGRLAPQAAFTGLCDTLRTHEHSQGHRVLLIRFAPAGAAAFLGPRLEDLAGTTTDLARIVTNPQDLDRFHERLVAAPTDGRRIQLAEEFLLARLAGSAPDPLVTAAAAWLERRNGAPRIRDLARHLGSSQSALERRFRRVVGVSPRKFAVLARLRRAVRLIDGGADFTTAAHAAGYFDQPHFIHDFRRAAGSSPGAFFRRFPLN